MVKKTSNGAAKSKAKPQPVKQNPPMTGEQYQAILDKVGLTQVGAAELLNLGHRTSRRYAAGYEIPEPTAKLLRLLAKGKISLKDIAKA